MNEPGSFKESSLEQLGAQAYGHYKAGEKNYSKAMEHAKSSGLYLIEAQNRLSKRKDMTFRQFLTAHCPIEKTRAYEFIAIAGGKTTVEEYQEGRKKRNDAYTAKNRAARSSVLDGQSPRITQQKQQKVSEPPPQDDPERYEILSRITAKLANLTIDQLHDLERIIPNVSHGRNPHLRIQPPPWPLPRTSHQGAELLRVHPGHGRLR